MANLKTIPLDIKCRIEIEDNRKEVLSVLSILKPKWKIEDIIVKPLGGGFVNQLLLCRNKDDAGYPGIVFKIFGESFSQLHDRDQEKKCCVLLSNFDLVPKVLCTFQNGLCYEFADGKTFEWDCADHTEEYLIEHIIDEMIKWHHAKVGQAALDDGFHNDIRPVSYVYKLLKDWPEGFTDEEKDKEFRLRIPSCTTLFEEAKNIERLWDSLNMTSVFCHNDLNIMNIVYQPKQGRVMFLDYEWTGFSSVAWEISYHLCSTHFGTALDLTGLEPSTSYIKRWVEAYLKKRAATERDGVVISENDVKELVHQVVALIPVTQFLIGLISIRLATIPNKTDHIGFDFIGVAVGRFDYYFKSILEARV